MTNERREAPRATSRLEVEVWSFSGPNEITDFSTTGAFVRTEGPSQFKPDDEVDLVLTFPTEEEATLLKGHIKRVTGSGVGIKFARLTQDHIRAIKNCYDALRRTKAPQNA